MEKDQKDAMSPNQENKNNFQNTQIIDICHKKAASTKFTTKYTHNRGCIESSFKIFNFGRGIM